MRGMLFHIHFTTGNTSVSPVQLSGIAESELVHIATEE
jgi:hypothetical protein